MKILWTDGSAIPNPGVGGFAVIEEVEPGVGSPVALGREENSTNIRMEGKAMIAAIKHAIDSGEDSVEIHSDSEFWINVLSKWAPAWKKNGWKKKTGEIKNLDIVKELYDLYDGFPVRLVWVRGHVGTKLNEMADEWANKARQGESI